jgi:hypothetical protein
MTPKNKQLSQEMHTKVRRFSRGLKLSNPDSNIDFLDVPSPILPSWYDGNAAWRVNFMNTSVGSRFAHVATKSGNNTTSQNMNIQYTRYSPAPQRLRSQLRCPTANPQYQNTSSLGDPRATREQRVSVSRATIYGRMEELFSVGVVEPRRWPRTRPEHGSRELKGFVPQGLKLAPAQCPVKVVKFKHQQYCVAENLSLFFIIFVPWSSLSGDWNSTQSTIYALCQTYLKETSMVLGSI